jgi:hypothetical protein
MLIDLLGCSSRPFYLLEDVIVDLDAKRMHVKTQNVNLSGLCDSRSETLYSPHTSHLNWTQYSMTVETKAFQGDGETKTKTSTSQMESASSRSTSPRPWGSIGRSDRR